MEINPSLLVRPEILPKLTPPAKESKLKSTACCANTLPKRLLIRKVMVDVSCWSTPPVPFNTILVGSAETNSIEPKVSPVMVKVSVALMVKSLTLLLDLHYQKRRRS